MIKAIWSLSQDRVTFRAIKNDVEVIILNNNLQTILEGCYEVYI